MSNYKFQLELDTNDSLPPTRDSPLKKAALPEPNNTKFSPSAVSEGTENARIYFVGTATTILEWSGIRLMTDPNFLHAGDHVHLGPGVTGTRVTNPAFDLHELPKVDVVLLSHYHADHFDEKVEASLRRDLPIITTPHAKSHLASKPGSEAFTAVHALDHFESGILPITYRDEHSPTKPCIRVTGMPGKHVPPGPAHILATVNDLLGAVPPTNGWMLELGFDEGSGEFKCGYRIYISGDTLFVDELKEIPQRYKGQGIDLMLVHLGGTTIPSPKLPLLMVTMDAQQGLDLIRLINPDLTIPIHFDDYDVFLSPLSDFQQKVKEAGLENKVVYLDRGDAFKFDAQVKL